MSDLMVTVIVGVVAAAPGIYAVYSVRRRVDAETARIYQQVASDAGAEIRALRAEVSDLRASIDRYERVLDDWREGIGLLVDQLCETGVTPAWTPDDSKDGITRKRGRK